MLNERIGQYRITGKLGQGGMGEIFSAHDERLNRSVAVKFIANSSLDSDASRRMFLREARAAAGLAHPFICTVHDVLEHEGRPVIVMEHVAGETLQALVARARPPMADVIHYGREILEALAMAHAQGIVHRDIKPGNIMITPAGHVKVMDFGLALTTVSSPQDATIHRSEELTNRIAGTLPYIAPEVLRGDPAEPAADVYATGIVFYEMVTGRRPFGGNTDAVLIAEILHGTAVPPRQINSDVPAPLEQFVLRLLSRDPRERPSSHDAIAELEATVVPRKTIERPSIAVLPFRAITADPESAHLSLALADAITSELALVRSLVVRPTAAIVKYVDAPTDPTAAARELAVDFVATGTFQRAGSRLRVGVQLISAAEERPLWSTKIDTSFDDIFLMQDEVSRKIVDALQLELTPADELRVARMPHLAGDALDLYARGRIKLLSESIENTNMAIDYFEKAHELDPGNPLPLAGLGEAYSRFAFGVDPSGDWFDRAKAMADRVLELDPELPEGRYLRAHLAWTPQGGFDHEYALRELASVVTERPNLCEAFDWIGVILFHVGLLQEATGVFDHAIRINPDDNLNRSHRGTCDILLGRYTSAIAHAEQALARIDTAWGHYIIALAQLHLGDRDAAERRIELMARRHPGMVLAHSARALIAAVAGDEKKARREIERTELERKGYGHFHHAEFDMACALATLGDHEAAIDRLEMAARIGFPCLPAVENETLLSGLRSHPRYRALVENLRTTRDHYRGVYSALRLTSAS